MNQETMNYKGYTAAIHWSNEESCYIGDVIGIEDIIFFRGNTLPELNEMFKEMIDEYLADCKKDGIEPNKPPTKVTVTIPIEIYAQAYSKAQNTGAPIHQFMLETVQQPMT